MLFSSMFFLWVFLPIVLAGSFLLRKTRLVNVFLVLASLLFYAWGEPVNVLLMLASVLINFTAGVLLERFDGASTRCFRCSARGRSRCRAFPCQSASPFSPSRPCPT